MPLYDMKCTNCGSINEFLIGLSELKITKDRKADLKELGFKCKNCKSTQFIKEVSAHGKTASNWASWQEGLGQCRKEKSCKTCKSKKPSMKK